jgi:hypothetical protein
MLVVLVQRNHARIDPVVRKQATREPRILGRDYIGARKTSSARNVMSRKFPSGVATTYNAGSNRVGSSFMQRQSAFLLLILALLYLGVCTLANQHVQAQQSETPAATGPSPHVAVLLPIKSTAVGRQADAVRLGIMEAAKVHRGTTLPLIIYATSDDRSTSWRRTNAPCATERNS